MERQDVQGEYFGHSSHDTSPATLQVDPDSPLAGDLTTLKEREGKDHILLSFMFKVT